MTYMSDQMPLKLLIIGCGGRHEEKDSAWQFSAYSGCPGFDRGNVVGVQAAGYGESL